MPQPLPRPHRLCKRVLVTVLDGTSGHARLRDQTIPLLPLYVTAMHASALTVGFACLSFSAMQLVATPVLGRLSDRYGRRRSSCSAWPATRSR